MWARSILLQGFLVITLVVCLAGRAVAELMTALFPAGVPGYGTEQGVTVETRLHPEQMPLGVREGAFQFWPQLDESFGYTSNAAPGPARRGSWQVVTAPTLTIGSDWSHDAIGLAVSAQDTRTLALPSQNRTDATVSVGGRIDIGNDKLTLAVAHLAQHEDRGEVASIASDRPIAIQIDDARASYEMSDGRWNIVPSVEATNRTYGATTLMGAPATQAYRDRLVAQGGATMRYELAPLRSLVMVMRGIGQNYTRTPHGQPNPDSTAYQVLAGIDYDDNALWRWRLLVGGETRGFASPQYRRQNTLITEGGVAWSPTGMTTVRATVSRGTEDAEQEGVSGLIYSAARLTIDHEYLRDLLLRASFGVQRADFFQGGYQTGTTVSVGATWVMNRNARLSVTYDQIDLHGSSSAAEGLPTGYSRGIGLVTMRLCL
ncbi:MAG TPA: outer membrane beta-barrel protein [Rhodopila sp.]